MVWIIFKVLSLHVHVKYAIELCSYFAKNKHSPGGLRKFGTSNLTYFAA